MKWSRATHHLEQLAQACADMTAQPASIFSLRVSALWAFGEVLASRKDLDNLEVVLSVDLPVQDVAWFGLPPGAEHWSNAVGLSQKPVVARWRSTRAPLWNHAIARPLLIWDEPGGVAVDALRALGNDMARDLRLPEPTPDELASRLAAELAVSLRALQSSTDVYEQHRFGPGKAGPVADALWRAGSGYLDVLAALA